LGRLDPATLLPPLQHRPGALTLEQPNQLIPRHPRPPPLIGLTPQNPPLHALSAAGTYVGPANRPFAQTGRRLGRELLFLPGLRPLVGRRLRLSTRALGSGLLGSGLFGSGQRPGRRPTSTAQPLYQDGQTFHSASLPRTLATQPYPRCGGGAIFGSEQQG